MDPNSDEFEKIVDEIVDDAVEATLAELNPHDPETYGDILFRMFGERAGEIHHYVDLNTREMGEGGPVYVTPVRGQTWVLQAWLPGTAAGSANEWTAVSIAEPFSHNNRHRMYLHPDGHEVLLDSHLDWRREFGAMLDMSILAGSLALARQAQLAADEVDDEIDPD
jgi:hypothetical protein